MHVDCVVVAAEHVARPSVASCNENLLLTAVVLNDAQRIASPHTMHATDIDANDVLRRSSTFNGHMST